MAENRFSLEKADQLALENVMLKEEILRRDFAKVSEQKEALHAALARKYKVNPETQTFTIDLTGITVKDK